jgi:hydroxypyruvate reductase
VLPSVLPTNPPVGRNIVLGAGKAAAEMAAVANAYLPGKTTGLVVTRYGHGSESSTGDIEVVEASHPVPDERSFAAAERMLELAASATADDRVLFMISGGGSALLCAPIDGVMPEKKQEITRFLLHSGASIHEINCVRKHLSRIKGGGLAHAASAAEMMTFAISDVVGDELSDIASGPSIPYERDAEQALRILEQYGYEGIEDVAGPMRRAGQITAPSHPAAVVATAGNALAAIAREVESNGWTAVLLGDDIEGRAVDVGAAHAELALQYQEKGGRYALISGGELTVEVQNSDGRGGPNLEYLASLMLRLDGAPGIEAIACDSDGIDGSEDNAGGYVSSTSLGRARQKQLDPLELLRQNNTYTCFEQLEDLIVTGPTRTNINDIRVILVGPADKAGTRG